jgi:Zn-dependent protease
MEEFFQVIIILFMAMVVHEYAHAWTAYRLGDPTAKMAGRMTLNPFKHIDPFGTIGLPLLLMALRFMGSPFFPIALAKPVPVNFLRLHHPKRDMIWVGLAGPAVNVAISIVLSLFLKFDLSMSVLQLVNIAIYINLILAIFNMVPIPPLDGSRLVMGLLPARLAGPYGRLERYGIVIIFALLPLGLFHKVVQPIALSCAYLLGVQFL